MDVAFQINLQYDANNHMNVKHKVSTGGYLPTNWNLKENNNE